MVSAVMMMTCLTLVAGAGPSDAVPINHRGFQIPIRLDEARRAEIQQVLLFVQNRDGTRWEQVGAVTPDKDGFAFFAPEDGLYQFKVAVVGRSGQRDPADIYQAPVGQKVLVDTVKPDVRALSAERVGDDVVVRWQIQEDHPDFASLKLEYRIADGLGGLWTPAPVANPQSGQASFRPNGGMPVAVRLQVGDLAQNVSRWAEVPVAGAAGVAGGSTATTTASLNANTGAAPGALPPAMAPAQTLPPIGDGGGWSPTSPAGSTTQPVSMTGQPARGPELSGAAPAGSRLPAAPPLTGAASPGGAPVLASAGGAAAPTALMTNPAARGGRGPLPQLQMTNKKQITLDYEVAKYGPSGVGSVELYVTRDDGRTWQKSGGEENIGMPPLGDPKAPSSSLKRSLTVELPADGVYGFILVVKSGAGLGKPPPQTGDLPQMRIEVDTRAPTAQLYKPEPDPTRRDTLILRWSAQDSNLSATPITLQWAERPGGSWETIGGGDLPNTGQFPWALPASIPHQVYLRLVVRDAAGNTAIAETPEPVLVDLNEPEVQSLKLGGTAR